MVIESWNIELNTIYFGISFGNIYSVIFKSCPLLTFAYLCAFNPPFLNKPEINPPLDCLVSRCGRVLKTLVYHIRWFRVQDHSRTILRKHFNHSICLAFIGLQRMPRRSPVCAGLNVPGQCDPMSCQANPCLGWQTKIFFHCIDKYINNGQLVNNFKPNLTGELIV